MIMRKPFEKNIKKINKKLGLDFGLLIRESARNLFWVATFRTKMKLKACMHTRMFTCDYI